MRGQPSESSAEASSSRSPSSRQSLDRLVELRSPRSASPWRAVRAPDRRERRARAPTARRLASARPAAAPLREQAVGEPEPAERAGELERAIRVVRRQPVERGPSRRGRARVAPTTPPRLRTGARTPARRAGEVIGMPLPELSASARGEPLARVLADRLEHQEAVVADRLHEAGVDERCEAVEVGAADLLGGLERERCPRRPRGARRAPCRRSSRS